MIESKAALILHPVRIRIIQTLIGKRLTVQEIMEFLPEVPQASLYRHLKKLEEAKLIEIVEKRKIRGTIEKVYALPDETIGLEDSDLQHISRNEHLNIFMRFIANILADYERYLRQEQIDLLKDGVGFRQVRFYASDEEFFQFAETVNRAMKKLMGNQPAHNRKKRIFTSIIMPEAEEKLK
ncbi:transcriptional regulator [Bacillaceae bacterium ZC4]|nr:transcriptional regulator [Bacillaceae bacterium ZC4]AXI38876.1 transcriptional regulator [Bacillaceae bacterium ZC4]